jgi:hypothetical protein
MMTKRGFLQAIFSLVFLLTCASTVWAEKGRQIISQSPPQIINEKAPEPQSRYTIMRPDRETRQRWLQAYKSAPVVEASSYWPSGAPATYVGGSKNLLSHLDYTPSERNQGSCGNCWAWTGTGVMGIALDVQEGIHERLSVQFVNSCDYTDWACCGGSISDFADFYLQSGHAIPWANANANWQDAAQTCPSGSPQEYCCDISRSPAYYVDSIEDVSISTQGVGKSSAIANIKSVLDNNKAVWFGFYLATVADWNDFYDFWDNDGESVIWDFASYTGHTYVEDEGGGQAVLCVGYDDTDPKNF